MSDESNPLILSSSEIGISCSFINFDGVLLSMIVPSKFTIRQLKKAVYKELTQMDLQESHSVKSVQSPEEIICGESESSTLSEILTPSMSIRGTNMILDMMNRRK